ncbi:hypothetical protein [Rhizobium grahamii]|uniref:N-acetyltransferase domain-containing protein n=1 Tax=Rhizobium grahamii CCGE 502 TaxID=990285 RepID=S3I404_9HYPH|nr:hypothetical protein [Rhizobium grahamii]EPE94373.1 hypothetical protein RGCCGE502_31847 [Rhizobium grahamii CCGE 502]
MEVEPNEPSGPEFGHLFPRTRTIWASVTGETRAARVLSVSQLTARARHLFLENQIDLAILSATIADSDVVQQPFWHPWCHVVAKAPEFAGPGEADVTVRTLEEEDLAVIVPLFAESLKAGLPENIQHRYSDRDLVDAATKRIEDVLARDSLAVVAGGGTAIRGFGLASNETEFLHVHDIVVSGGAAGTGTGLALARYIEGFAYLRKLPEMRGTVSVSRLNNHERTLASLASHGWKSVRFNFASLRSGL